ncbi:uncharacterized protein (DUF302 family) [Gracilibacillus halotolerans]|uniref:Uncharacterized protein (DUF302 family) n=1 Tax=Gracilibacillus halotolerans TaxID=74386 RepID=A0A841RL13_9BACI|nr:hypothetical protein [Gracilibacillus halotolerans]MBB6513441.1 uncharacterized protein (DUF302 family) [Gracilibacillus halotolerans]
MESNQPKQTTNKVEQKEMSYNEAIQWMAEHTGGRGTSIFSNTDAEEVRKKNQSK